MSSGSKLNSFLSPVKGRLRRGHNQSEEPLLPAPETPLSAPELSMKNEPDPWENLNNMYRFVPRGSPLEVLMSVVQHVKRDEAIVEGQKEFKELLIELEAIFARLQKVGGALKVTDSIHNICRAITEEADLFYERQDRRNGHKDTEDGSHVDLEALVEYYQRLRRVLRRLSVYSGTEAHFLNGYVSAKQAALRYGPQTPGRLVDTLTPILSWVDTSIPGSMYWVKGTTGTGKTTIAFSLCEELKSRSMLAARIFLTQMEPQRREPKLIIPYLAYQLNEFSVPYHNWDGYPTRMYFDSEFEFHSLRLQFQTLILKPLQEIKESLPMNAIVVVDGLDRFHDGELAIRLLQTVQVELPVKFVVFSQPGIGIGHHPEEIDAQTISRVVQLDLDNPIAPVDIETYLRSTLAWMNPPSSQFTDLVQQADNSLAYVMIVTRYSQSGEWVVDPLERLGTLLRARPAHLSRHTGIGKLYNHILRKIFQRPNLDPKHVAIVQHILHMVACYRERLTLTEIVDLLNVDRDRVISTLKLLRPVIHVFEYDGLVVPLHISLPSYLLDSGLPMEYYRDPNNFLAHRCFDHIRDSRTQFNIGRLRSSYKLDDDNYKSSKVNFKDRIFSSRTYACYFWADHMQASNNIADLEIRLEEFLSHRLLLWLEIMNLTKNIEKAPIILDIAVQWAKRHAVLPKVILLAEAALHFVMSFATSPASQSTPHIYLSLLSALPLLDPIRRAYSRRIQGAVRITGPAVDRLLILLAKCSVGGQVYSAVFAPDGAHVALGAGNDVQIVDAFSGRPALEPFKGHDWSVTSVGFSPDGTRVVSGSRDKTIRVWNSLNGELVMDPLKGHTGHIRSVVFSPSGAYLVSSSNDTTIRVWDATTGELKFGPLSQHTDYVKSIAIFSDDSRIVSGSQDGTICIWDLGAGDLMLGPLKGHTVGITSVCLSPDDRRIVTGSADRTLLIWDSQSGQISIGPLIGHTDWVLSVAFTPDGSYIISSSSDCTICIWDATTGELMAEPLREHHSHVYSVSCSPDGSRFVSTSGDETFCLWKAQFSGNVPVGAPAGHTQEVQSICVASNGTQLVSGSSDQTICVWDTSRNTMNLGPLVGHSDAVSSVCFSDQGKTIVSGSCDGTVRTWDSQTGAPVAVFEPPDELPSRVNTVASANTSPFIISGASNGTLTIWSTDTGERVLGPFKRHYDSVQSAKFSPDDSRIVTGSLDRTIYVLNAQTGDALLGPLWGHTGGVQSVGFSPDGDIVISGSSDRTVRLWNARTGQLSLRLEGHGGPVLSVQFSPNGALIASGSQDHTIWVWDARSGAIRLRLTGHTGSVNSVGFLPDGDHVISASSDKAIRIWNVQPQPSSASGFNYPEWKMDEDGWIDGGKDSEGQMKRLAWLNPKLRTSLMTPRCTAILSREGYVRLEIEGNCMGESWTGIYQQALG